MTPSDPATCQSSLPGCQPFWELYLPPVPSFLSAR